MADWKEILSARQRIKRGQMVLLKDVTRDDVTVSLDYIQSEKNVDISKIHNYDRSYLKYAPPWMPGFLADCLPHFEVLLPVRRNIADRRLLVFSNILIEEMLKFLVVGTSTLKYWGLLQQSLGRGVYKQLRPIDLFDWNGDPIKTHLPPRVKLFGT